MTRFQQEIQSNNDRIIQYCKENNLFLRADKLLAGVDLTDVGYLSVTESCGKLCIYMSLSSDHKDSRLAHVIARKLHVTFEKEKSWSGEELKLKATTDDWVITIDGSVPATCRVVEREEPLTEEQIETAKIAALASVKPVRVIREIVCKK